jgi:Lipocalin-like domain
MVLRLCVLVVSFVFAYQLTSHASDTAKVVGTWKLVSFVNEFQDGSEARGAYGNNPTGYVIFTQEGRVMFMVEAEGRKPPENDEQRAAAFRTIIAYTGTYRLEGDKLITKVDVSWNPAWVGTEQVRDYKLEDNTLKVISPWVMSPNLGKMTRATVTWQRGK